MKTIGIVGGLSYESTITYYRIINEQVNKALGDFHSSSIILNSIDFNEIIEYVKIGDWNSCANVILKSCLTLQRSGADFIIIANNCLHKVVPLITPMLEIPILHIEKTTLIELRNHNIQKAGLIGTKELMTQDCYKTILNNAGVEVIVPSPEEIEIVDNLIVKELWHSNFKDSSRGILQRVTDGLDMRGAQGIILGCCELNLLISQKYIRLPLFDSMKIHAQTASREALKN